MHFLGLIPARYGSTRLEGKPLVDIHGKPMIQRVYEQASKALDTVYVATDDERIEQAVRAFGGNVVMTSKDHSTGTNRCIEALEKVNAQSDVAFDAVVNIQGDEPMMEPSQLKELLACFEYPDTDFATLVTPVKRLDDLYNESEVFVVLDKNQNALYFSRSAIPHVTRLDRSKWLDRTTIYKHLGLYAYTEKALKRFAELEPGHLEQLESLEQLRWLENGGKIKVGITAHDSIPVDTVDDLERVRDMLKDLEGPSLSE